MIRSQQQLSRAAQNIYDIQNKPVKTRKTYGGLCHSIPILIRQSGLCQTVAWIDAKAKGDGHQAEAYQLLRQHLTDHLRDEAPTAERAPDKGEGLLGWIQDASPSDYMIATRLILESAIYSKRLAVSILNVKSATEAEEAGAS